MVVTDKLIVTVAPVGSFITKEQNPNLPVQPEEIAEEVYRAWNEGAAVAHIHARDKNGVPTTDPAVFREIGRLIREKGCDIILQYSTAPGREPTADIEDGFRVLEAGPEMISIDIGVQVVIAGDGKERLRLWTRSFVERLARAALEKGVKPELEIYTTGGILEANYLIENGLLTKPYAFNFVLDMQRTLQNVTRYSPKNLINLVDQLPPDSVFTTMAIAAAEIQAVTMSMLLGGHARVGMEDNIYYKRGVLAKSNAELVARVVRIGEDLGRSIATPEEARQILGLKPLKG